MTNTILKLPIVLLLFLGIILSSCAEPKASNQIENVSLKDRTELRRQLIRYIGRKPEDASHKNKFEPHFDDHYENEERGLELEYYYKNKEGKIYFLFTRITPSIMLKKVGVAGAVQFDDQGKIVELEEVYRTWKHVPEKLKEVNDLLFEKMINGEDLSPYYTENSNGVEYIEFPNKEVWYDKKIRSWETSRVNPLEEFYQEKIEKTQQLIDEQKQAK